MAKIKTYNERDFEESLKRFKIRYIKECIFREWREKAPFYQTIAKKEGKREEKEIGVTLLF